MACPQCEAATEPADKFCRECGTRLLPLTVAEKRRAALRQAGAVAREGGRALEQGAKLTKKGLETRRGRSVAACAAIGVAAGAVVPVIGPIAGGALGAAAGLVRKL